MTFEEEFPSVKDNEGMLWNEWVQKCCLDKQRVRKVFEEFLHNNIRCCDCKADTKYLLQELGL